MFRVAGLVMALCAAVYSDVLSADVVTPSTKVQEFITIWDEPGGNKIGELRVGQYLDYRSSIEGFHQVGLGRGVTGYVLQSWSTVLTLAPQSAATSGELALHFLDVGQGDSTFVVCPDGSNILIDAGSMSSSDFSGMRNYLLNNLNGNRYIDQLVLAHPDASSFTLIQEKLQGFKFGHTFYLGVSGEADRGTATSWQAVSSVGAVTRLDMEDFDVEGSPNSRLQCGGADLYVLAAHVAGDYAPQSDNALVLKIEFGQFSAILSGGESREPERVMLERYGADFLDADLLKTATPWRLATPAATAWIDAVKPKAAVISASSSDFSGNAWAAVITQLERHTLIDSFRAHELTTALGNPGDFTLVTESRYDEQIYSTADSGNIVVTSDGQDYQIREM